MIAESTVHIIQDTVSPWIFLILVPPVCLALFMVYIEVTDSIKYRRKNREVIVVKDPGRELAEARAREEIAEIEWQCGLIEMPKHLRKHSFESSMTGASPGYYTHRAVLLDEPEVAGYLKEGHTFPTRMPNYKIEKIPFEEQKRMSEKAIRGRMYGMYTPDEIKHMTMADYTAIRREILDARKHSVA